MTTCQKLDCEREGEKRIVYTSEHTPDQRVGAYACTEHEQVMWEYFEDHEHYYPIEKERA